MSNINIDPLVSVIVPIYNAERYVNKCVDSILSQTYKNIEVILIDDGSTDESRQRIAIYRNDSRCRIIYKDNGGASSARNVGINLSTGEYIYFVDADDYIDNAAIEKLVHVMQRERADFCCYKYYSYDGVSHRLSGKSFSAKELHKRPDIIIDALLGKNIKVSPCLKFFSSSFIKDNELRFHEGIIYEDYLFTVMCAIRADKVAFLNEALYFVFERPNSVSRSMNSSCILSFMTIDKVIRKELRKANIYDLYIDIYEASLKKQILYVLVMAACRIDSYENFAILFENATKCNYLTKAGSGKIYLLGAKIYLLYKLSLWPWLFYIIVKSLMFIRIFKGL